jgi:hypothetical protein
MEIDSEGNGKAAVVEDWEEMMTLQEAREDSVKGD